MKESARQASEVAQTTFADWACEQLGLDARSLVDPALDAILSPDVLREERVAQYRRSQLRNSHGMGRLLERYVERRRQLSIPESGLVYSDVGRLKLTVRLALAQIAEVHRQFEGLPLSQHRARFMEAMKARL